MFFSPAHGHARRHPLSTSEQIEQKEAVGRGLSNKERVRLRRRGGLAQRILFEEQSDVSDGGGWR